MSWITKTNGERGVNTKQILHWDKTEGQCIFQSKPALVNIGPSFHQKKDRKMFISHRTMISQLLCLTITSSLSVLIERFVVALLICDPFRFVVFFYFFGVFNIQMTFTTRKPISQPTSRPNGQKNNKTKNNNNKKIVINFSFKLFWNAWDQQWLAGWMDGWVASL